MVKWRITFPENWYKSTNVLHQNTYFEYCLHPVVNITKEEISGVIVSALKEGKNFPYIISLSPKHPDCVCQTAHNALIVDGYEVQKELFDCYHGNVKSYSIEDEITDRGSKSEESRKTLERLLFNSLKKKRMTVSNARKGLDLTPYLKNKVISFRVSPEEYNILQTSAKQENISISKYIRRKIF